jgi:hypothetical protein
VRPRFDRVVAERRLQGVEVSFVVLDADSGTVCEVVHMNGSWRSSACGGTGPGLSFANNLAFPVEVRLVGWDDRGCLAVPVCLTVH